MTFCSLDSESRTYDDKGRILEIGYGAGEVVYTVTDWHRFLTAASSQETESSPAARAWRSVLWNPMRKKPARSCGDSAARSSWNPRPADGRVTPSASPAQVSRTATCFYLWWATISLQTQPWRWRAPTFSLTFATSTSEKVWLQHDGLGGCKLSAPTLG